MIHWVHCSPIALFKVEHQQNVLITISASVLNYHIVNHTLFAMQIWRVQKFNQNGAAH